MSRSVVLGTAGHVDHGKSSLLRALTGLEPDRLPEERRRGMTIDLNFLWLDSWLGRVGLVDVPGHRRFLKNMVGGVFPLDGFLFAVAADDGWMPQSEEHLQVLRGLGVTRGLVVVTKTDLVSEERARNVAADAARRLGGVETVLFSTARPETTLALRGAVEALVASLPPVEEGRPARLWIDRVFAPKGLGVVVTGTLRDGYLEEGDEVRLWPAGRVATVKSLQRYHEPVRQAAPVSRVAVQLARVGVDDVARGMLLCPGELTASDRAEARLRLSADVAWKRGAATMALHLGTARATARLTRLDGDFVRVQLDERLPLAPGDRFVLRTAGEETTLGAGEIIDPRPPRGAHATAVLALRRWEEALPRGAGEARIAYLAARHWLLATEPELAPALADETRFQPVGEGFFAPRALWERAKDAVVADVAARAAELRGPVPEGELIRRLAATLESPQRPARRLLLALAASGVVKRDARGFLPPGVTVADARETERQEKLRSFLAAGNGQPVSLKDLLAAAPDLKPTLYALVKAGELVSLGEEHFVARPSYEGAVAKVRQFLRDRGQAPTTDLKALLTASRRSAVLLLEQMDRDRVTYLKDGVRRLLRTV